MHKVSRSLGMREAEHVEGLLLHLGLDDIREDDVGLQVVVGTTSSGIVRVC
jgi:hypothetical protein